MTLFRLLNGDHALGSQQPAAVGDLIRAGRYPPRNSFGPHIHDRLRRVVRRATHLDLERRYPSAARPVVSWKPFESGTGAEWEGWSVDGTATWRAFLVHDTARSRFRVERRRAGGAFRAVNAVAGEFDDPGRARAHAGNILRHIAAEGKT